MIANGKHKYNNYKNCDNKNVIAITAIIMESTTAVIMKPWQVTYILSPLIFTPWEVLLGIMKKLRPRGRMKHTCGWVTTEMTISGIHTLCKGTLGSPHKEAETLFCHLNHQPAGSSRSDMHVSWAYALLLSLRRHDPSNSFREFGLLLHNRSKEEAG